MSEWTNRDDRQADARGAVRAHHDHARRPPSARTSTPGSSASCSGRSARQ
jgi:hypothetical protein